MNKIIISIIFITLLSNVTFAQYDSLSKKKNFSEGDIIVSTDASLSPDSFSLSNKTYDELIIGVYRKVKTNTNYDTIHVKIRVNPVYSKGTTLVKYNSENGTIKKGDPITSSSEPGVGMKATNSGIIVGIALEDAKKETGLIKIRVLIQYIM